MKIKVVNQRLYLEPPETAEGTREYLRAEFSFSEEWDGMTKTAFFRGADGENHPKLKQTSDTQQLALFRLAPELKTIGVNYWLRNVAGSQTYTLISQYGEASSDMATSTYGVRPVFAVG